MKEDAVKERCIDTVEQEKEGAMVAARHWYSIDCRKSATAAAEYGVG